MKIAVASSGLGHVPRGIETWARDTASALARSGVDATLFAAGEVEADSSGLRVVVLPSLRRGDPVADRLAARSPGWSWRWQLKSPYGWEQLSFWRHLWPRLRRGGFDVLHVQDPMLAYWCRLFRKCGLLRTREILAHGTEETGQFLSRFEFVQHLAPWHLEQTVAAPGTAGVRRRSHWRAIPNFVDVASFRPPADAGERAACRAELGLPADALVFGTVSAVKKHHKRVDYLIREFAAIPGNRVRAGSSAGCFLLIAGARTSQSDELVRLAEELAPGRVRFLFDRPRAGMPGVYRAMDVFVLVSLFEMMPIALLEALASGLPAVVHSHPVLEWIIGLRGCSAGPGGGAIDMAAQGALAGFAAALDPDWLGRSGRAARARAKDAFSMEQVVAGYIGYYREVLST